MTPVNERLQSVLSRHQAVLVWLGIVIVLLLIILVMLSWVTMLKVSLLQENPVSPTVDPETSGQSEADIRASVIAELAEKTRAPLNDVEKAEVYERLNKTETIRLSDAEKAAVVASLQKQE